LTRRHARFDPFTDHQFIANDLVELDRCAAHRSEHHAAPFTAVGVKRDAVDARY
jgi:hypothetical protein